MIDQNVSSKQTRNFSLDILNENDLPNFNSHLIYTAGKTRIPKTQQLLSEDFGPSI